MVDSSSGNSETSANAQNRNALNSAAPQSAMPSQAAKLHSKKAKYLILIAVIVAIIGVIVYLMYGRTPAVAQQNATPNATAFKVPSSYFPSLISNITGFPSIRSALSLYSSQFPGRINSCTENCPNGVISCSGDSCLVSPSPTTSTITITTTTTPINNTTRSSTSPTTSASAITTTAVSGGGGSGTGVGSGSGSGLSCPITPPSIAPVAYANVTVVNYQNISAPVNFQQMIVINSSDYKSYINGNWSNVEFTTDPNATGAVLQAWVESNATNSSSHTIVWVNITRAGALGKYQPTASGQPSISSSVIFYMDFLPMNASILSTCGPTGEAPQLSSTYAKYDNGAHVFDFYDNFAGSNLNYAKWSNVNNNANANGGFIVVDNGTMLNALATSQSVATSQCLFTNKAFGPNITAEADLAVLSNGAGNVASMQPGLSNLVSLGSMVNPLGPAAPGASGMSIDWGLGNFNNAQAFAKSRISKIKNTRNLEFQSGQQYRISAGAPYGGASNISIINYSILYSPGQTVVVNVTPAPGYYVTQWVVSELQSNGFQSEVTFNTSNTTFRFIVPNLNLSSIGNPAIFIEPVFLYSGSAQPATTSLTSSVPNATASSVPHTGTFEQQGTESMFTSNAYSTGIYPTSLAVMGIGYSQYAYNMEKSYWYTNYQQTFSNSTSPIGKVFFAIGVTALNNTQHYPDQFNNYAGLLVRWARVRAFPPNGIMPNVTISNILPDPLYKSNSIMLVWNMLPPFNSTCAFSSPECGTVAVYGNYVYAIGGSYKENNVSYPGNNVYYAQLLPKGNLSSWHQTTSYPMTFYGCTFFAYNGILYCISGGNTYGGNTNPGGFQSFAAPINGNAAVGAWHLLSNEKFDTKGSCFVNFSRVYCMGSSFSPTNQSVYSQITVNGTETLENTTSYPVRVISLFGISLGCAFSFSDIYCAGGSSGAYYQISASYYAPLTSNGIGNWTNTTALGGTNGCIASNSIIYCFDPAHNQTFYASISLNGIGKWRRTTYFAAFVYNPTCFVHDDYLYCFGGNAPIAASAKLA